MIALWQPWRPGVDQGTRRMHHLGIAVRNREHAVGACGRGGTDVHKQTCCLKGKGRRIAPMPMETEQ